MPRLEDLDISQLPKSVFEGRLVDLHDLVVVLNFIRANLNPCFRSTKLVEVTKSDFEAPNISRNVKRKWSSADPEHRIGMVFDVDTDDDNEEQDYDVDIPKYFTPSTMIKRPPSSSLFAFTPKQLETMYWQAQNHGGSNTTTNLLKRLFETWPDPPFFLRVRIPPSQGKPRVEYITYAPAGIKVVDFTMKNRKELSVIVTPVKTFVNGTRGETPYSVIGFSPMKTMSSDPDPVNAILDLASMQHGDAGRAFKCPFVLTHKEEYVEKYLPTFAESTTFAQATYHSIRRNLNASRRSSEDDDIKDIVTRAREYSMMKVRNKAAYCAYCGMPELVEAGLFSTGAPMDRCSVCKIEYYCGEEHQKLAWSYHKHFCQPFSPSKLY